MKQSIKIEHRINKSITSVNVRVINQDNEQLGIMELFDALQLADDIGLDLVEIGTKSDPPVCRIMDYSKYKYQIQKKEKSAKKNQKAIITKEIRLRPVTENHDFQVKLNKAIEFLKKEFKVKVTVIYKGREISHSNIGIELLQKFINGVSDVAFAESSPVTTDKASYVILIPGFKKH